MTTTSTRPKVLIVAGHSYPRYRVLEKDPDWDGTIEVKDKSWLGQMDAVPPRFGSVIFIDDLSKERIATLLADATKKQLPVKIHCRSVRATRSWIEKMQPKPVQTPQTPPPAAIKQPPRDVLPGGAAYRTTTVSDLEYLKDYRRLHINQRYFQAWDDCYGQTTPDQLYGKNVEGTRDRILAARAAKAQLTRRVSTPETKEQQAAWSQFDQSSRRKLIASAALFYLL